MNGRIEFQKQFDVSRETLDRLDHYEALLVKWNKAINLVSPQTLDQVWTRHFLDSAQIFNLSTDKIKSWADLGSGGGFPGLVVAILATEKRPDLMLTLVESDTRKSAFLATIARDLSLSVQIENDRIEKIDPLNVDVLSARALASLDILLGFAQRHLAPAGICLFPKGARWRNELADAQKNWSFSHSVVNSMTDSDAVVLEIGNITHV